MSDLSCIAEALRPLAVPVDSVHEDPSNVRAHPDLNVQQVAESLRRFGQQTPIVVNRAAGMIVEAGNGTLRAARLLEWTHIAAVMVDDEALTSVGYAIADNRISELGGYDLRGLLAELESFESLPPGFDEPFVGSLRSAIEFQDETPPEATGPYEILVVTHDEGAFDAIEDRLREIAAMSPDVTLEVERSDH